MQEGVLSWPFFPACDLTNDYPALTDPQRSQVVAQAVEWLWSRSGRQYGTRTITLRPQAKPHRYVGAGLPGYGLQPVGAFTGLGWGPGWDEDRSPENDQVLQLDGPVVSVTEVRINGVLLDGGVWRQEGNWLVRQDGGTWPRTQNMVAPLGVDGTWSVTYVRGFPVTPLGQYATGKLICHFAKQMAAGQPCQLPMNTTTVTRAGVSIQRDASKAAQTSPVPEVDQWLALVNPRNLTSAPKVWSPDVQRHHSNPFAGSYYTEDSTPPIGQPVTTGFLVLGPTDPVPAGVAVGTVILRTQT